MSYLKPNIFDYIGKKTDEQYTHEKFLASLLRNEILSKRIWESIKATNQQLSITLQDEIIEPKSVKEQYILKTRPVDIFFFSKDRTNKKRPIIIELKINADDQDKQILDYYNTAKEEYKDKQPIVLYITLNGREPKKESYNYLSKNNDFFCLKIIDLIKSINCNDIKENYLLSFLTTQYLNLVEELTPNIIDKNSQTFISNINSIFSWLGNNLNIHISGGNIIQNGNSCSLIIHEGNKLLLKFSDSRLLYGITGNRAIWEISPKYVKYLSHLTHLKKIVYYNEKPKDFEIYKNVFLIKKNKGQKNIFLFYQDLDWILNTISTNVMSSEAISDFGSKIIDFIIEDYTLLSASPW